MWISGEEWSKVNSRCKGPGAGVGLVCLRSRGQKEELKLEAKQGPDQTWASPLSEMGSRRGLKRRELIPLGFQMDPSSVARRIASRGPGWKQGHPWAAPGAGQVGAGSLSSKIRKRLLLPGAAGSRAGARP